MLNTPEVDLGVLALEVLVLALTPVADREDESTMGGSHCRRLGSGVPVQLSCEGACRSWMHHRYSGCGPAGSVVGVAQRTDGLDEAEDPQR